MNLTTATGRRTRRSLGFLQQPWHWYLQGIQPDSVFRQTFNAINEPKEQLIVLEGFLNSILDKEKC